MPQPERNVEDQGPWLAAALFCDSIIEDETTGARSLIRLHQGGEFFEARKASAYGEPVMFLSFIGGKQEFTLDGPGSGHDAFALMGIVTMTDRMWGNA